MSASPRLSAKIAREPTMRVMLGSQCALLAAACAAIALVQAQPLAKAAIIGAMLLVTAVVIMAAPTDRIHPAWFHVAPVLFALNISTGMILLAPNGAPMALTAIYSGAVIPFVLVRRAEIVLQLLLISGAMLGALVIGGATTFTAMTTVIVIPVVWALGAFIAIVWEQAEEQERALQHLSQHDPLTGLSNRRVLDRRLEDELARHAAAGRELTLLTLDLNGFKAINDGLGHTAGDEALCDVAGALLATVREQDTVARQGGDEFCILAPETGAAAAQELADKVRRVLGDIRLSGAPLSAGVGVATFPQDALTAHALTAVADDRQRADKAAAAASAPRAFARR